MWGVRWEGCVPHEDVKQLGTARACTAERPRFPVLWVEPKHRAMPEEDAVTVKAVNVTNDDDDIVTVMAVAVTEPSPVGFTAQLKELRELRAQGLLSEEEYKKKKKFLISAPLGTGRKVPNFMKKGRAAAPKGTTPKGTTTKGTTTEGTTTAGTAPPMPSTMGREGEAATTTKGEEPAWAKAHADRAKARCPCCVSSDGVYIYRRVPTKHHYILTLCLHMVLCPQQGCDPQCNGSGCCFAHCGANIPFCPHYGWCCMQSDDNWARDGQPLWCWCALLHGLAAFSCSRISRSCMHTGSVRTAITATTSTINFVRRGGEIKTPPTREQG